MSLGVLPSELPVLAEENRTNEKVERSINEDQIFVQNFSFAVLTDRVKELLIIK